MGGGLAPGNKSSYPKLAVRPVGQQIKDIYTSRLDQFRGNGQYSGQNLIAKLWNAINDDEDHVKLWVYSPPDLSRPTFKEATSHEFKPTKRGESFGPSWSTHWFKIKITIPEDMRKEEHLEFKWDTGSEGLIWTEDGHPLQGLTGGGERVEWVIPSSWRDGKEHTFYIEVACNSMFGNSTGDSIQPPDPNRYFQLGTASINAVNMVARRLYMDFWEISDAAREFPDDSWEKHKALQICNRIMDTCINAGYTQESLIESRKIASEYIGEADSAKVYDSGKEAIVYAIGHCHIDTCWLWPWDETKRKVARSWSNQCDLMDRYPEHRFACSQAQQYKWLEQLYPTVYDRVKAYVKKGRFHPIGGSWVEHDTNMPSGESLVRQFLYGQRYFESRFGERCKTFWLPDTFGYSSQLPQLSQLAGMPRFFTQKISWNNINDFPHSTFNWVSPDGTQVICHMAPANTYTAEADFGDVRRSQTQHKSMDQDHTSLLVFGKGDGGGGPTREHLDKLRRCRGMADKTGLLPRVTMGPSVDDFFDELEDKVAKGTEFVTWYGELYLELHRGTYTTQANNKLNNRKSEIMMHDLEFLATLASFQDKSYKYPKKDIDEIWEGTLLCQFHDCLPGSAIEMCYDDSDKLYAKNFEIGKKLKRDAVKSLGLSDNLSGSQNLFALNTLPWKRAELVRIPGAQGQSQRSEYAYVEGKQGLLSLNAPTVLQSTPVTIKEEKDGVFTLTNSHFKVQVEDGCITSLYDRKADREVVAKGAKANQLVIFDDKPLYWQAWDVEVFHLNSRKELKADKSVIVESGPYRVSVATDIKISDQSSIKTTISLSASKGDEPSYVEVDAEVDWHETMKFLKVEFPVDVVNTEASYETQYGVIRRPTHYNTSWDMAKFEVCCHKFADLSEHGYGVSILNDSKYGFATAGNLMRLSLLRAPKAPDAHADMGQHKIRWAIMPHSGGLGADTVKTAYNFNNPMHLFSSINDKSVDESIFSAFTLNQSTSGSFHSESLILDAIKRAEDDPDVVGSLDRVPFPHVTSSRSKGKSVILRVYESLGGKAKGTLTSKFPIKKAYKCNLLEDDLEELKIEKEEGDSVLKIELRAFEVATYRVVV